MCAHKREKGRESSRGSLGATYVQRDTLVERFVFVLLEGTQQQLAHAFAKVAAQEGVQQRVDAGVEVRHQEGERCEECVEVGITLVVGGPGITNTSGTRV